MIGQLQSLLSTLVPPILAAKGISKLNPKLGHFISSATAAGYGTDQILQFMRDKFHTEGEKGERQRLATSRTLRPDEAASKERLRRQDIVPDLLQKAASIGLGAGVGGLVSRMGGQAPEAEAQHPQAPKGPAPIKPGSRQEALGQYNQMQQEKRMIDKLVADFQAKYGQANVPQSTGALGMNPAQPQPQVPQGGDEELMKMIANIFQK